MNFARKILENYGWKDGDGLGKNKGGIVKPLKATLKFDKAGFGADQAADDLNNHWWERVFNEAATNVNIRHDGENIKMCLKDEENSVEITTKCFSTKKMKKLKKSRANTCMKSSSYGNFLKSATLTNMGDEVENVDKIDTNEIEVTKVKILTDEQLFKACGGRTAHKGARHGLKLSGKLARIEQQDSELLGKILTERSFGDKKLNDYKSEKKNSKAEKNLECSKQTKKKNKVNDEAHQVCQKLHVEVGRLKRKKRKHCEVESEVANKSNRQEKTLIRCGKNNIYKKSKIGQSDDVQTSNINLVSLHDTKLKNKKDKDRTK